MWFSPSNKLILLLDYDVIYLGNKREWDMVVSENNQPQGGVMLLAVKQS